MGNVLVEEFIKPISIEYLLTYFLNKNDSMEAAKKNVYLDNIKVVNFLWWKGICGDLRKGKVFI